MALSLLFPVLTGTECVHVRARCYPSMKTKDEPHAMKATLIPSSPVDVIKHSCKCKAGEGFCQHLVALLYQISHYQALKMKVVPEVVSCTSAPQKWGVPPRTHGFETKPLTDVKIVRPTRPSQKEEKKKSSKKYTVGIESKLYNPIVEPLAELDLPRKLMPGLAVQAKPCQWLQLWDPNKTVPLVPSKFGPVPKGSILSYQEKKEAHRPLVGPEEAPPFDLPKFTPPSQLKNLTDAQKLFYDSVSVTVTESREYEKLTRKQSGCTEWFTLHNP